MEGGGGVVQSDESICSENLLNLDAHMCRRQYTIYQSHGVMRLVDCILRFWWELMGIKQCQKLHLFMRPDEVNFTKRVASYTI